MLNNNNNHKEYTPLLKEFQHNEKINSFNLYNSYDEEDDEIKSSIKCFCPKNKKEYFPWLKNHCYETLLPRIRYYLPIIEWISQYKKEYLVGDIIAGISVGVMLVPQGLAYSSLARVPPIYGLYTAFIPLIIYTLFGNSKQLSLGPEAVASILVGSNIVELILSYKEAAGEPLHVTPEEVVPYAISLSLIVGIILFILGLFRFGFLDNILSRPILQGFITAVAIIIGVEQFDIIFGFSIPDTRGLMKLWYIFQHFSEINIISLFMGMGCIFFLLGVGWLKSSKFSKLKFMKWLLYIPQILIVVILGILITYIFHLNEKGLQVLGKFEGKFPVPTVPPLTLLKFQDLFEPAMIIAIIGFIETSIVSRYYGTKYNYSVSSNRELVALGMSNLIGSFFGAWPCFASLPRSSVNDKAGAKSALAGFISSLIVLITILFLLSFFELLPKTIMAGIVVVAAIGLIEIEEFQFLLKIHAWKDLIIVGITCLITIILGTEIGLITCIGVSLFVIIKHSSMPTVTVRGRIPNTKKFYDFKVINDINLFHKKHDWFGVANDISDKGILVIKPQESLYFVNIRTIKGLLRKLEQRSERILQAIVIDVSNVATFDTTAVQTFIELIEEYKQRNIIVCLVKLKEQNREIFWRSGLMEVIGVDKIFSKTSEAISFIEGIKENYSSYQI